MGKDLRYIDVPQRGSYVLFENEEDATKEHRLFIFVHGFNGDPQGTWSSFPWMLGETRFGGPADAAYFANPSTDSIENGAKELSDFLKELFGNSPFLSRNYTHITLVGHSQGCVVIRRLVLNALEGYDCSKPAKTVVSKADVALFAPAHLGFAPSGAFGFLFRLGLARFLFGPLLGSSTSYVEMSEGGFLSNIQSETEKRQEAPDACRALKPRVVFGEKEKVVLKGHFSKDVRWPTQPKKDHVTICKPSPSYPFPMDFVFDRRPAE